MIQSIRNGLTTIRNELPDNTFKAAGYSGLFSFAISGLLTRNLETALIMGCIGTTASLISSLTSPLFKRVLADEQGNLTWYKNVARIVVNMAITQFVLSVFANIRINLMTSALVSCIITTVGSEFRDTPAVRGQVVLAI